VAAKGTEQTPVDDLTRLPLPILMRGTDFYLREVNYHHHFHPEASVELGYTESGKKLPTEDPRRQEGRAVRYSRGQIVPKWLHTRYHNVFMGPELPQDPQAKFTAVVLACAGVIPRRAINLYTSDHYEEVELSDKQHDFIRRRVFYEGAASQRNNRKNKIGKFLATYAMDNSLSDILSETEVNRKVEEFLMPKSEEIRVSAGRFILSHAVDASVANLIELHQEAKKEGMIKNSKKMLGEIVLKYFPEYKFKDYLDPLEDRLAAMYL
jgi:hypothetical protein